MYPTAFGKLQPNILSMALLRLIQSRTRLLLLGWLLVFSVRVHSQSGTAPTDCSLPLPVPVLGDFRMVGSDIKFQVLNANDYTTDVFKPVPGIVNDGCGTNRIRVNVIQQKNGGRLGYSTWCNPTSPDNFRNLQTVAMDGATSISISITDRGCGKTVESLPFVIPWGTNVVEFTTNRIVVKETQGAITLPLGRGGLPGDAFVRLDSLTVPLSVAGTAGASADYQISPGTISSAGTTGTARVRIFDDNEHEQDETIVVKLDTTGLPSVVAGTNDTLTIVITDNDTPDTIPFLLEAAPTNIIVQPDGRILVAGEFESVGSVRRPRLARLNPDLTMDNGFQPPRWIDTNSMRKMTLHDDGRILLLGTFSTGDNRPIYLRRLYPDGTEDTTLTSPPGGVVRDFAVDGTGGILLAGALETADLNYTARSLVRLQPDGLLDPVFSFEFSSIGLGTLGTSLAPMPDGTWVLGGGFRNTTGVAGVTNRNRIIRLLPNGSTDATFLTGGGFSNSVSTVVTDRQGRVIAAGAFSRYQSNAVPGWARVKPDGAYDTSFAPTASGTNLTQIAVLDDGRILALGNGILREFSETGVETSVLATNVTTFAVEPSGTVLVGSKDLPRLWRIAGYRDTASIAGFTHGYSSVPESASKTTVMLQRRGSTEARAEVDYEIVPNGTFADGEFAPTAGTVVFPPGERLASIEVRLNAANSVPNDNRSLMIRLRAARSVTLPSTYTDHILRFEDDDIGLTAEVFGSKEIVWQGQGDPKALMSTSAIRFHDPVTTRRDEVVHFEWEKTGATSSTSETFAMLWTGWLVPEISGDYVLMTTADDGSRVWLDDRLVLQNWRENPTFTSSSVPISLQAGIPYRLAVAFFDGYLYAHMRLQWRLPGTNKFTTIPGRNLRPGISRKLPIAFDWAWKNHPAGEFNFTYLVEPGRPLRIESTVDGNTWLPVAEGVTSQLGQSNTFACLPNQQIAAGARLRAVCVDGQVADAPGLVPLVITARASDLTQLIEGGTNQVKLSAYANGGNTQLVQWWRDGVAMATGTSLVISGTNSTAPAVYYATVEAGGTTATSGTIVVSFQKPPRFGAPKAFDLVLGQSAELSIAIEGSTPMSFQWYQDGVTVPSGTNATLILSPVVLTHAGNYSLQATNAAGTASSPPLQVRVSETIVPPSVLIVGDSFSVNWATPYGAYEWQESDNLEIWRPLLQTNLISGPFQFTAPLAPEVQVRFYRLVPIRQ